MIKMHIDMFENFGEKVQFVFENLEGYTAQVQDYADLKWRL